MEDVKNCGFITYRNGKKFSVVSFKTLTNYM